MTTNFRFPLFSSSVVATLFALAACASPGTDAAEAVDATEQEAQSAAGIELRGTGDDANLRIALTMVKDRDNAIWDTYLKRVRVSRQGGASFESYCGVGAKLGSRNDEVTVSCTKYTSAVDSRQSLDFEVMLLNGAYTLRKIELHGTGLRAERDLLTGGRTGDKKLDEVRAATDPTKNPFAGPRRVNAALRPMLGQKAYAEATGKDEPITGFEYSFTEYLAAGGTVFLDYQHRGGFGISLAKREYHAAEGLVTDAELAQRLKDSMPTAPQCSDGPTPGSVGKPAVSMENAMTALGGPSFGLADEVKLTDVPAPVASKLKRAGQDIEKRTFEGTDYSASVFGYYAIHASCGDPTIIGYAVWGGGSGEPDYHDGIVVGFDLAGHEIFNVEDSG